jgi:signal peptidase I
MFKKILEKTRNLKVLESVRKTKLYQLYKNNLKLSPNFDYSSIYLIIPVVSTFYVVNKKIFSVSTSEGESMEPTIQSGDVLIIDHFFYKIFGLKKDDIVVCVQPVDPNVHICKRIIQVGGE